MKMPALFNRMGSDLQIQNSVLGVNGTNVNATFDSGKFENAVRIDANDEKIIFYNQPLNMNSFTIEFWLNTDTNYTNGVSSDGAYHDFIYIYNSSTSAQYISWLSSASTSYGIYVWHTISGLQFKDTASDWNAGTWKHIAMVLDRSASFDGGKTTALYIDGVQTASASDVLADIGIVDVDIYIGSRLAGAVYSLKGVIDNIKVYDYPKTDFSDRENERGGMDDQIIM